MQQAALGEPKGRSNWQRASVPSTVLRSTWKLPRSPTPHLPLEREADEITTVGDECPHSHPLLFSPAPSL
ncbi:hypothetical protein CTAM01_12792 [Colletotrichum tamarilloi]|uniref:Uncharacterized protein n=1 Tax=Colletotrichum tamarilloi TaxID=1209934 RepID=A0ABQ9T817_9PEZI|nr:uncharacterized protein CTAM01_12792 [Colletotrichum tamarilloi]KAK1732027.1 hypothetical protein CTAM01_12792 [Colletotrichum tamarilloi]